jgi:prepilin-type processing-associated H-X9-DG protein
MGDPGSGPFTAVGSYPADQHGTYEIQANGRIHLAFADGSVKDKTIAVLTDTSGNPDPVREGLMLDEDNFYVESD